MSDLQDEKVATVVSALVAIGAGVGFGLMIFELVRAVLYLTGIL